GIRYRNVTGVQTCALPIYTGFTSAQTLDANGHLVRNTQPLGGSIGLGSSPCTSIRSLVLSSFGSGNGTALNKTRVYGCSGFSYKSLLVAISIICPKYITPTRSLRCRTIYRSWSINKEVNLCSTCYCFSRFTTCA